MNETDLRPEDHDRRMHAARARATWELGDPSWAHLILDAYWFPENDAAALRKEMDKP